MCVYFAEMGRKLMFWHLLGSFPYQDCDAPSLKEQKIKSRSRHHGFPSDELAMDCQGNTFEEFKLRSHIRIEGFMSYGCSKPNHTPITSLRNNVDFHQVIRVRLRPVNLSFKVDFSSFLFVYMIYDISTWYTNSWSYWLSDWAKMPNK